MAKLYYDKDVDPNRIKSKKVAVIGYGSQGHAHALNLHNSGVEVMVGLRDGSSSKAKAEENGVKTGSVADATKWADVIMILTPDTRQAQMYRDEVEPNLEAGNTLMFAHGFNVRFGEITPPANVDVSLVAPKAPGHRVREVYVDGGGVPNLVAVHQDVSGNALEDALSYSWGIGGTRAGTLITTFAEETETDLFGEQAVLCGGVSALVKAGFETLVNAGYQPEVAYFECMHELKLIVDLFYRGGLNFMRYSVSDTAEHGDYHAGDRIVTAETKAEMALILKEIQEGKYAKTWIGENLDGRPVFNARRVSEQAHQIEKVGAELRSMMPFIDPVVVKPEDQAN